MYLDRYRAPSDKTTLIVPNLLDTLPPIIRFYGGVITDQLDAGTTRTVSFLLSFGRRD